MSSRLPDSKTAERIHHAFEAIAGDNSVEAASATCDILSDRPPMMPAAAVPTILEESRRAAEMIRTWDATHSDGPVNADAPR